jgi:flagellar basal body L-ring protein FlgH
MIFVETDKGLLLLPLEKIIRPDTIRDALNFIDLSKISDEELKALLEE